MKNGFFVIALILTALTSGCQMAAGPMEPAEPVCIGSTSTEDIILTAEQVLTGMQFSVEKLDAVEGYLKTRPLSGSQFFQFWREDTRGAYNWAETNLHSIQRTVEINVQNGDPQSCIECIVDMRRLSLPQERLAGVHNLTGLFSGGDDAMRELEVPEARIYWIPLGRDGNLENYILETIRRQLDVSVSMQRGDK